MVSRLALAPWIITTWRTGSVARSDIDDVEFCAGDLDCPALRGIFALQGQNTGLRDQRQHRQRRHDNY
jgi:hypothetical protein